MEVNLKTLYLICKYYSVSLKKLRQYNCIIILKKKLFMWGQACCLVVECIFNMYKALVFYSQHHHQREKEVCTYTYININVKYSVSTHTSNCLLSFILLEQHILYRGNYVHSKNRKNTFLALPPLNFETGCC